MTVLEQLIKSLARLPGIGRKSATRMAYFLLQSDFAYTQSLAEQIRILQTRIKKCSLCGGYTENDPCSVCADSSRDRSLICVVEQSSDILTLEATGEFRGLYHVLGGTINPLDGVGPDDLSISALLSRVHQNAVQEIILATNPSVAGDTTALYLGKVLKDLNVVVTRLASGLPVGGDLEYADRLTLTRSLRGRVKF